MRPSALRARPGIVAVAAALLVGLAVTGCSGSSGGSEGAKIVAPSTTAADAGCGPANEAAVALGRVDVSDPKGLAELPAAIARLSDVVPSKLQGDVATIAEAVDRFVAVLERYDYDTAAIDADAKASAELRSLGTPEFVESLGKVRSWLQEACGS